MAQNARKSRVLVIEDEAMIGMLIEDMVQQFGGEIIGPATQFDQALTLAREAPADVALVDINLGGTLTYSVADVLRERGIPFVFATGYGSAGLPDRFQGSPTLQKPFGQDSLEHAVQTAMAQQSRREPNP